MAHFLANPAAAMQGQGGGRRRVLDRPGDLGLAAMALAGGAGVAIWSALARHGYKPELAVALIGVLVNITVGAWVSTQGRRRRALALLNFSASFMPLIVALAHGGEFDPEVVLKIYEALA